MVTCSAASYAERTVWPPDSSSPRSLRTSKVSLPAKVDTSRSNSTAVSKERNSIVHTTKIVFDLWL